MFIIEKMKQINRQSQKDKNKLEESKNWIIENLENENFPDRSFKIKKQNKKNLSFKSEADLESGFKFLKKMKKENPSENFNSFPFVKYPSSIKNITTTNEDSINDNSKIIKKNIVGYSPPSKHPAQNFFKLNNKILKIKEKNLLTNKSDLLNVSYGMKEEGQEKLQNSISYQHKEKTKKLKKDLSSGFRDFYEEMKNILIVENRKVFNNTRNEAEGSSKQKKEIDQEESINIFKRKKNVKHRTAKEKIKIPHFNIKNMNENLSENPNNNKDSDFKINKIRNSQDKTKMRILHKLEESMERHEFSSDYQKDEMINNKSINSKGDQSKEKIKKRKSQKIHTGLMKNKEIPSNNKLNQSITNTNKHKEYLGLPLNNLHNQSFSHSQYSNSHCKSNHLNISYNYSNQSFRKSSKKASKFKSEKINNSKLAQYINENTKITADNNERKEEKHKSSEIIIQTDKHSSCSKSSQVKSYFEYKLPTIISYLPSEKSCDLKLPLIEAQNSPKSSTPSKKNSPDNSFSHMTYMNFEKTPSFNVHNENTNTSFKIINKNSQTLENNTGNIIEISTLALAKEEGLALSQMVSESKKNTLKLKKDSVKFKLNIPHSQVLKNNLHSLIKISKKKEFSKVSSMKDKNDEDDDEDDGSSDIVFRKFPQNENPHNSKSKIENISVPQLDLSHAKLKSMEDMKIFKEKKKKLSNSNMEIQQILDKEKSNLENNQKPLKKRKKSFFTLCFC